MNKDSLYRYNTLDGTMVDLRRSPTGMWVNYELLKSDILHYLRGINRMVRSPGSEGQADHHNECIDNIEALFQDKDPLDDEIADAEKKLNELKDRKNGKSTVKTGTIM
jgi:hypothetical protein